ncbi:hypothetical protein [Jannaschia sp. R86511]|uniref:hypothetical protein n=1 Tax=Jannaschia sp. R86511 TaxID=3093853 RepID=UPI0036D39AD2
MTTGRRPLGPSPWPGSRHEDRHRWQLDRSRDLAEAASILRLMAGELVAAHRAGWWLVEPMRNGHLLAQRASRRTRRDADPPAPDTTPVPPPGLPPWRLRVVDDPPAAGEPVLRLGTAETMGTPVIRRDGDGWAQTSGPGLSPEVVGALGPRLDDVDLRDLSWAVVPARVGPLHDLVADGSGLRVHSVRDGVLVRTMEVLPVQHAADGAASLPVAAAAYGRVADIADAMAAAGGRLSGVDDGLILVGYDR